MKTHDGMKNTGGRFMPPFLFEKEIFGIIFLDLNYISIAALIDLIMILIEIYFSHFLKF